MISLLSLWVATADSRTSRMARPPGTSRRVSLAAVAKAAVTAA